MAAAAGGRNDRPGRRAEACRIGVPRRVSRELRAIPAAPARVCISRYLPQWCRNRRRMGIFTMGLFGRKGTRVDESVDDKTWLRNGHARFERGKSRHFGSPETITKGALRL